jgi:putative phosphoribosyl transferase
MLFREDDQDNEMLPFKDRMAAGRILATKLSAYSDRQNVIVLGLPRGGLPVAFQVARALHAPLDVFVVRKLGVPWNRELAMGAVASGGLQILDLGVVKALGVSGDAIREVASTELKELECRERLYRGDRPPLQLAGMTVILVDDGIATGSSILAAVAAIRRQKAARIVVAVPVATASACKSIGMEADDVVTVVQPQQLLAVSQWYEDFSQTTDEDVRTLLEDAGRSVPRAA